MKITVRGLDPISAAMLAKRLSAVVAEDVTIEVERDDDDRPTGLAPDTVVIRA